MHMLFWILVPLAIAGAAFAGGIAYMIVKLDEDMEGY
jgi:hypothetical protein